MKQNNVIFIERVDDVDDSEVRVTANSSCTLPTVPPRSRGAAPAPHPASIHKTLPPGKRPPPYRQMDMAERSKSITRLLQHSILQLCNEHVGYSHKLQILGVLCMTVDDEQHELVVKVNNTLKRVNPPQMPAKDANASSQLLPPAVAPVAPSNLMQYAPPMDHHMYNGLPPAEDARTATPSQSPPQQAHHNTTHDLPNSTYTPSRKSHGRKGAKPVKVQHVFDEGEIFSSDEDQEGVLTVIPTDPESSFDVPSPRHTQAQLTSPTHKLTPGGAKRKVGSQYDAVTSESHNAGATGRSISAVRALLLGRAANMSSSCAAQDLSTGRSDHLDRTSPPRGLTLPVFVAPQMPNHINTTDTNARDNDNSPANYSVSETSQRPNSISPSALDGELQIKEEPDDFSITGYNSNNNNNNNSMSGSNEASAMDMTSMDSTPEDLSQHMASMQNYSHLNGLGALLNPAMSRTMDGLPTQVPYTIAFSTSTPNKHMDGLSIQYTANGPITVASNGKNVSQPSRNTKVKDIILYDDSSPLHEQRGNRIETDYMLDSFGIEGRKRRRRNADETLTSEEIAEYLGSLDITPQLFKCKYCTDEMRDLTQYLQHTLTMHHCYICHQCGKSFTTKSSLLRHRPIHTGMRRFACSICKKTFYRKDKCKAHIKRHLGETGETAEVEQCEQSNLME